MAQDVTVYLNPPELPVVDKDFEKGKPNETIFWNFLVIDPAIVKVRIEFKNPNATFFKIGAVSQNWFEKDVQNGHSQIYGRVPKYNKTIPTPEPYTVSGLDITDTVVTALDPSVIIDEP